MAAPKVREDGLAHQANATAKAVAWSVAYGGMAIASDGGLVAPALGDWWDSLRTRRFLEGGSVISKVRKVQGTSVPSGGLGVSPRLKSPPLRHGEGDIGGEVKAEGDDLGRAHALLSLMAHLDGKDRRAYWVEAAALADRGRLLHTAEAQSGEGIITREVDETLIKDGFWVGAVWYFPQIGKRYAELTPEELGRVGDHWTTLKGQMRNLLGQT
ncbi:MAG: hypothetical protein Q7K03_08545 [Dehalococcoidia bacterium]|nr:hypothetical protein [Dehalococcoidia bacterium]